MVMELDETETSEPNTNIMLLLFQQPNIWKGQWTGEGWWSGYPVLLGTGDAQPAMPVLTPRGAGTSHVLSGLQRLGKRGPKAPLQFWCCPDRLGPWGSAITVTMPGTTHPGQHQSPRAVSPSLCPWPQATETWRGLERERAERWRNRDVKYWCSFHFFFLLTSQIIKYWSSVKSCP